MYQRTEMTMINYIAFTAAVYFAANDSIDPLVFFGSKVFAVILLAFIAWRWTCRQSWI